MLADTRQAKYEQAVLAGRRTRKPGGGRHGKLTTATSKVLLVLVDCKLYPTYDDLGSRFGMSKFAAFSNLNTYFPLVAETLARLGVLPHRTFKSLAEFRELCVALEEVIIVVTERRHARPKDQTSQTDSYSGKNKMHSVKNTIIATVTTFILFVGQTFGGRHHDYNIFKTEFPTATAWFEHLRCLLDWGYQGIHKDYKGENRQIPFKRGRKSKYHPNPTLTDEQREFNREWSCRRLRIEHSISGIKRFNILVDRCRGRKPELIDEVIVSFPF